MRSNVFSLFVFLMMSFSNLFAQENILTKVPLTVPQLSRHMFGSPEISVLTEEDNKLICYCYNGSNIGGMSFLSDEIRLISYSKNPIKQIKETTIISKEQKNYFQVIEKGEVNGKHYFFGIQKTKDFFGCTALQINTQNLTISKEIQLLPLDKKGKLLEEYVKYSGSYFEFKISPDHKKVGLRVTHPNKVTTAYDPEDYTIAVFDGQMNKIQQSDRSFKAEKPFKDVKLADFFVDDAGESYEVQRIIGAKKDTKSELYLVRQKGASTLSERTKIESKDNKFLSSGVLMLVPEKGIYYGGYYVEDELPNKYVTKNYEGEYIVKFSIDGKNQEWIKFFPYSKEEKNNLQKLLDETKITVTQSGTISLDKPKPITYFVKEEIDFNPKIIDFVFRPDGKIQFIGNRTVYKGNFGTTVSVSDYTLEGERTARSIMYYVTPNWGWNYMNTVYKDGVVTTVFSDYQNTRERGVQATENERIGIVQFIGNETVQPKFIEGKFNLSRRNALYSEHDSKFYFFQKEAGADKKSPIWGITITIP